MIALIPVRETSLMLATCDLCSGEGVLRVLPSPFADDPYFSEERKCPACNGAGVDAVDETSYQPEEDDDPDGDRVDAAFDLDRSRRLDDWFEKGCP
jgi:hypothetical protein